MNRIRLLYIAVCATGLWGAVALAARGQQIQVTAGVDNARPMVGDEITYIIKVEGAGDAQFQTPALDGFVAGNATSSKNYSIVNGNASASITYSVTLKVMKKGTLTIPAATAVVGGKAFPSNPVQVIAGEQVSQGMSATLTKEGILPAQAAGNPGITNEIKGRIFVRPVISKINPYPYEQVVVTYLLYVAVDIYQSYAGYNYTPLETSNNSLLIVPTFQANPRQNPDIASEVIDNVQFRRWVLAQAVVFPLRAGAIELPLFQAKVGLSVKQRQRDFFLFGNNIVEASAQARTLTLNVQPLPTAGKPANFSGAVGDYKVSAAVNKAAVKEYEMINLVVTVAGAGNVGAIPAPELGKIEGIEVFESKGKADAAVQKDGQYGGKKTFEIVLQPTMPGDRVIPPVVYSFFNPRTARYESAQSNPIPIKVEVDPNRKQSLNIVSAPSGINPANAPGKGSSVRMLTDLPPLKPGLDLQFHAPETVYDNWLFWGANVIPLAALGLALVLGARRQRMATDEAFARSSTAKERASKRLKGAAAALKQNDMLAFYAEAARALRGLVADRCALAAAGATNEELRAAVAARANSEGHALGERLVAFLEACDAARYAPGSPETSAERWEEAKQLVKELERKLK
ncbi:MAG: BatD family protein [Candidatus Sumerlaeota bacterium]|nr:BatD family protein [Candidatus Sumerlaeota bacterium]